MTTIPHDPTQLVQRFAELRSAGKRHKDAAKALGLSEIHYDRAGGFSIFPEKKPFRIIVGFDDFDTKLKRLAVAMEKLKSSDHSFASIDLNYEGKVILTM